MRTALTLALLAVASFATGCATSSGTTRAFHAEARVPVKMVWTSRDCDVTVRPRPNSATFKSKEIFEVEYAGETFENQRGVQLDLYGKAAGGGGITIDVGANDTEGNPVVGEVELTGTSAWFRTPIRVQIWGFDTEDSDGKVVVSVLNRAKEPIKVGERTWDKLEIRATPIPDEELPDNPADALPKVVTDLQNKVVVVSFGVERVEFSLMPSGS